MTCPLSSRPHLNRHYFGSGGRGGGTTTSPGVRKRGGGESSCGGAALAEPPVAKGPRSAHPGPLPAGAHGVAANEGLARSVPGHDSRRQGKCYC